MFEKRLDARRAGIDERLSRSKVSLVNAPGTGVADDKAVYAYVPKMIKYYLGEEMILPNVPTHLCADETERKFVLENIADLVIKPANESGGLRHLARSASFQRGAGEISWAYQGQSAKLRSSANAVAFSRPDFVW